MRIQDNLNLHFIINAAFRAFNILLGIIGIIGYLNKWDITFVAVLILMQSIIFALIVLVAHHIIKDSDMRDYLATLGHILLILSLIICIIVFMIFFVSSILFLISALIYIARISKNKDIFNRIFKPDEKVLWSGKPYIKKNLIIDDNRLFLLFFLLLLFILSIFIFLLWLLYIT